jgi:hypothetical protein
MSSEMAARCDNVFDEDFPDGEGLALPVVDPSLPASPFQSFTSSQLMVDVLSMFRFLSCFLDVFMHGW